MSYFTFYLGKWIKVPVYMHWSLSFLFVLMALTGGAAQIPVYCGMYFIVLLHELGHCYAGKKFNAKVHDIFIFPLGGIARIEFPDNPKEELIISIAGPAVNFALIPVFSIFASFDLYIFHVLAYINIIMMLFNLIPAYPMDGGRILRSILSFKLGRKRATKIASAFGWMFGVAFFIVGILLGYYFFSVMGALLCLFSFAEVKAEKELAVQEKS